MPTDVGETIGTALGRIAREAAQNVSTNGHRSSLGEFNGSLSGMRGVAAGAALGATPFAAKGAGKLVRRIFAKRLGPPGPGADGVAAIAAKVKGGVKGAADKGVKEAVGKRASGAAAVAKKGAKSGLPAGGGGEKADEGAPGAGKGRRMPVQQAVDVAVPVSTAYNQWTQFEEWPQFMHRLDRAAQEDECTISFKAKIWGISKEFEAEIIEQRPDERIMWTVRKGPAHKGVVTFHQLADRLTRVQVTLDVEPGSLLEKAARGMRHVKRAVRADLARFKAFIEMQEVETGAWRGVIHDGKLVEDRDSSQSSSRRRSARPRRRGGTSSSKERSQRSTGRSSRSRATRRSSGGRSRSGARSRSSSGSSRSGSSSRS